MQLKSPPPLKSAATLPCAMECDVMECDGFINLWIVSSQLYSTVTVQSDEKHLITVNIHEGCYLFVYLHRLIYTVCLKCPPLAHMHVFSREYHRSMGCVNCALFNAVSNVYIHNWKEWVMHQTKYCNNVTMTSLWGCRLTWSILFSLIWM